MKNLQHKKLKKPLFNWKKAFLMGGYLGMGTLITQGSCCGRHSGVEQSDDLPVDCSLSVELVETGNYENIASEGQTVDVELEVTVSGFDERYTSSENDSSDIITTYLPRDVTISITDGAEKLEEDTIVQVFKSTDGKLVVQSLTVPVKGWNSDQAITLQVEVADQSQPIEVTLKKTAQIIRQNLVTVTAGVKFTDDNTAIVAALNTAATAAAPISLSGVVASFELSVGSSLKLKRPTPTTDASTDTTITFTGETQGRTKAAVTGEATVTWAAGVEKADLGTVTFRPAGGVTPADLQSALKTGNTLRITDVKIDSETVSDSNNLNNGYQVVLKTTNPRFQQMNGDIKAAFEDAREVVDLDMVDADGIIFTSPNLTVAGLPDGAELTFEGTVGSALSFVAVTATDVTINDDGSLGDIIFKKSAAAGVDALKTALEGLDGLKITVSRAKIKNTNISLVVNNYSIFTPFDITLINGGGAAAPEDVRYVSFSKALRMIKTIFKAKFKEALGNADNKGSSFDVDFGDELQLLRYNSNIDHPSTETEITIKGYFGDQGFTGGWSSGENTYFSGTASTVKWEIGHKFTNLKVRIEEFYRPSALSNSSWEKSIIAALKSTGKLQITEVTWGNDYSSSRVVSNHKKEGTRAAQNVTFEIPLED